MKAKRNAILSITMLFLAGASHLYAQDIVINELHYDPDIKVEQVEFVEIYNAGTSQVDLAGWYFSDGISYAFTNTTLLNADATLVVGQDPTAINTKFGVSAHGPFAGKLNNDGERVALKNASGVTVDRVDYQLGFPWPTVGDPPGHSMQLLNPAADNDLGGNWRSATPTPAAHNAGIYTATSSIPPRIRQVDHSPEEPVSSNVVTITAKVTDPDGVSAVTLHYQLVDPGSYIRVVDGLYETTWSDLAMNDGGTNGDVTAGDSIYTVEMASAIQQHRRLVRYRITVEDTLANSVRTPYADDPQSNFAYFVYDGVPAWAGADNPGGTGDETNVVVYGTNVMRSLPTYHLIAQADDVFNSQYNATYDNVDFHGTMVYDGTVYDHIRFRNRGEVSTYATGKNKWKFKFNRGHAFKARDNYGKRYSEEWDIVNFEACTTPWARPNRGMAGVGQAVAHKLLTLAGVPSSATTHVHFRIIDGADEDNATDQYDGDLWGLYMVVEHPDGRFLDARDLPDGNVFKMEGSGDMKNQGPTQPTDGSDLTAFINGYNSSQTIEWWRANVDLQAYYSFRAVGREINNHDMRENWNYVLYHNTNDRWTVIPWDLDLLYTPVTHWSGVVNIQNCLSQHSELNIEYENRGRELQDLLFTPDQLGQVVDEVAAFVNLGGQPLAFTGVDHFMWNHNPLTDNSTDPRINIAGTYYENPSVNSLLAGGSVSRTLVSADHAGMVQWIKDFMLSPSDSGGSTGDNMPGYGYTFLSNDAADANIPYTPTITYTGATNYPANVLTFDCGPFDDPQGTGTFAALKWRIGEITDTNSPAYDPTEPRVYEITPTWESDEITPYTSSITIPAGAVEVGHTYRVRIKMKDTTGRWSHWSAPVEFSAGEPDNAIILRDNLGVSEVMYNPPEGSDYEFIELYNTGTNPLDITDVVLAGGIDFAFSGSSVTSLAANAYVVVVRDLAAFSSRHDTNGMTIAGEYTGKLNNGGEEIEVQAAGGTEVLAFEYNDARGWPLAADGAGHSLVPLVLTNQAPSAGSGQANGILDHGGSWRASAYIGGSPGLADPDPVVDMLINEFAAHTDTGLPPPDDSDDWIELHSVSNMTLTDWYLSDDADDLKQWQIPTGTVITADGWVTFYESTGFHSNRVDGFGLDKAGEQIFVSYLPGTDQDRVADCVRFEGQENGASWGRYPDGADFWYAMALTPAASNRLAAIEPVISRIMYHPPSVGTNGANNTEHEYIVIQNDSTNDVELWNAVGPWRISGIGYTLPSNTVIGAGEGLTIVPFDPADALAVSSFLATHNLLGTLPVLLGPHGGTLANTGERLALERPQAPDAEGESISWAIVDEVIYSATAPWPDASANGSAIHRLDLQHSGNDPANWTAQPAALPTPKIMLTSPWTGSNMLIPFSHTATAVVDGSKLDGALQHVAFFLNGTQSLGTDTVAPFEAVIDHTLVTTAGTYSVHAEVVDDGGSESSVAAAFTADFATRVGIASPTNGASILSPFSTDLVAWVDDKHVVGAVTISFLNGTNILGVDGTEPYEVSIDHTDIPGSGTFPLYAVLDDDFASSTSGVSLLTIEMLKGLPFEEGFEGYAVGDSLDTEDPDGSHPWAASDVVVTNDPVRSGSRAAALTSETAVALQTFNDGQTEVWTDFYYQPVFGADDPSVTEPPADASFAFYVHTNGQVVAYNGTNETQLAHAPLTEGQWVRFTVHSDHTARIWALYLNGKATPIATGLGFFDSTPAASYTEFGIRGAGSSNVPVDSITIDTNAPALNAGRLGTVIFGR